MFENENTTKEVSVDAQNVSSYVKEKCAEQTNKVESTSNVKEVDEVSLHIDLSDSSFTEDTDKELNELDKSTEQLNTSRGKRELKMLLELSKEANLETNIQHKRRTIDPVKLMEKVDPNKAFEIRKRSSNSNEDDDDEDDDDDDDDEDDDDDDEDDNWNMKDDDNDNPVSDKVDNTQIKEHNLKRKSMTSGGIGGALKEAKLQRKSLKLDHTMSKVNIFVVIFD